jgi:hypothetical protein
MGTTATNRSCLGSKGPQAWSILGFKLPSPSSRHCRSSCRKLKQRVPEWASSTLRPLAAVPPLVIERDVQIMRQPGLGVGGADPQPPVDPVRLRPWRQRHPPGANPCPGAPPVGLLQHSNPVIAVENLQVNRLARQVLNQRRSSVARRAGPGRRRFPPCSTAPFGRHAWAPDLISGAHLGQKTRPFGCESNPFWSLRPRCPYGMPRLKPVGMQLGYLALLCVVRGLDFGPSRPPPTPKQSADTGALILATDPGASKPQRT